MNKPWIAALAGALVSLSSPAEQPAPLEISDAWVRALPPTQTNTAAYMTLTNRGDAPVQIAGANADIAQSVEIHTTREIDGYMRMEQLSGLSLAPGQSQQLAPGGIHLMLLELSHMPIPGETVRVCLELAPGGQVCTDAGVRKGGAGKQGHEHHQHHQK